MWARPICIVSVDATGDGMRAMRSPRPCPNVGQDTASSRRPSCPRAARRRRGCATISAAERGRQRRSSARRHDLRRLRPIAPSALGIELGAACGSAASTATGDAASTGGVSAVEKRCRPAWTPTSATRARDPAHQPGERQELAHGRPAGPPSPSRAGRRDRVTARRRPTRPVRRRADGIEQEHRRVRPRRCASGRGRSSRRRPAGCPRAAPRVGGGELRPSASITRRPTASSPSSAFPTPIDDDRGRRRWSRQRPVEQLGTAVARSRRPRRGSGT